MTDMTAKPLQTTHRLSVPRDDRRLAMLQEMGLKVWAAPPRAAPAAAAEVTAMLVPRVSGHAPLDWQGLQQAVATCNNCGLCKSRTRTVFGTGDPKACWMVVGEAPGEQEDLQGLPFVGPSGQLLDQMLRALGLSRDAAGDQGVFICNVLKCRPPANRNPTPEEVALCEPYLRQQVAAVQPRIILALGRFAALALLQHSVADMASPPLSKLRGAVHSYHGIPLVVSYHPAYLLRAPEEKSKTWADLCLARAHIMSRNA
jgi:DNA polymerase